MERTINRDVFILSQKSTPATAADLPVAADLMDTLKANAHRCVGMAANMIGVNKRIIAVSVGMLSLLMLNPAITKKSGPYETEEGCLSLPGTRKTKRFESITVKYQDRTMKWHTQTFTGYVAQIIQHEVDHCDGILI